MKKQVKSVLSLGAAVAVALTLGAGSASADSITYTIDNNGGGGLAGYPSPYASVLVNRTDSTHATVTFTSLTTSGTTYLMGGENAADVNVNATTWTIGSFSATGLAGFTNGALSDTGSGNVNGFGVFNETVKNFDGYTNSHNQISFVLTNTSGTWATAGSVLAPNASGFAVAIHGFACAAPCTTTAGALTTGAATTGGGSTVPEPTSVLLLGSGVAGIGLWGMKRRKNA